jgi:hypothetical protein
VEFAIALTFCITIATIVPAWLYTSGQFILLQYTKTSSQNFLFLKKEPQKIPLSWRRTCIDHANSMLSTNSSTQAIEKKRKDGRKQ